MEAVRIVLFATFAAIAYGIVHDQFTAHICVEYFTIAHPPVFPTNSPFLLALGWGVIATWWVGLLLGLGLAAAARLGRAPKLTLIDVRRPVLGLLIVCALSALLAGFAGALLNLTGIVPLLGIWASVIPADKHVAFSAVAWAHTASYAIGAAGGLFIIGRTARQRRRQAINSNASAASSPRP